MRRAAGILQATGLLGQNLDRLLDKTGRYLFELGHNLIIVHFQQHSQDVEAAQLLLPGFL